MRDPAIPAWPLAALLLCCGPPLCPPPSVSLPATGTTVPWLDPARPLVPVTVGGASRVALLDTGWPRSAIALASAGGLELETATLEVGGAIAGPLGWDVLAVLPDGVDLVVGADVLARLPLVLDARAATARVLPAFTPGAGSGSAPLALWSSGLCRGDRTEGGPEGPDLLLVEADLDGRALTLAIDTGAELTLVRRDAVPDLAARPTLSGIPLRTAFAGTFLATATRARALSAGGQASASSPVLLAPEIDAGLEELARRFRGGPARLDGLLGRAFLRELLVSLALGEDAARGRSLGLTRFDTQAHWTRDLVGVGISTTRSTAPPGLRIASLFSVSPAADAGLRVGDLIVTVDGVPALDRPPPWGSPGTAVSLGCERGASTFTVTVTVADLLPDPP